MQLFLNAIDFMADGGPARQPGKPGKPGMRALCIEEGGQQGGGSRGLTYVPGHGIPFARALDYGK